GGTAVVDPDGRDVVFVFLPGVDVNPMRLRVLHARLGDEAGGLDLFEFREIARFLVRRQAGGRGGARTAIRGGILGREPRRPIGRLRVAPGARSPRYRPAPLES